MNDPQTLKQYNIVISWQCNVMAGYLLCGLYKKFTRQTQFNIRTTSYTDVITAAFTSVTNPRHRK